MTGTLLAEPVIRAVNASGLPISGAQLQFYVTGTTTPTPVYTSASLGTPLSNPVISDSGGLFAPIFLDPTVIYRAQLKDGGGTLIRDIDPLNGIYAPGAGSITASMLAAGAAAASLGYTPLNKAGDTATNLALAFTAPAQTSAGYLGAPLNEQDSSYTFVASDAGKMVRTVASGPTTYTIATIAASSMPLNAVILIRNAGTGALSIMRSPLTVLYLAGGSTNKDCSVAANGLATLVMETANSWVLSGVGIS